MNAQELVKLIEGLIVVSGLAAIFWALFKNQTTKNVISTQNELIKTLQGQIQAIRDEAADLRNKHIDNEKAISKLQGQVDVYKELPLANLSSAMSELARNQAEILKIIKKK